VTYTAGDRRRQRADAIEHVALVALRRRVIDLVDARVGELAHAQRAAIVAGAEQHDLAPAAGDELADRVVEHSRAHLHVRDPRAQPGNRRERARCRLGEQPLQARARERDAIRIVRDPDAIGQRHAERARGRDPLRRAARRAIAHQGLRRVTLTASARGRSRSS
jgi:hypothetical protein